MQNKPIPGKYEFTEPFSITGCVEYVGVGIAGGMCKKEQTVEFAKGDVIYSDKAFYDDATDSWSIGIVFFGQNRSIPLSKVVRRASQIETAMETKILPSKTETTTEIPVASPVSQFVEQHMLAIGAAVVVVVVLVGIVWWWRGGLQSKQK